MPTAAAAPPVIRFGAFGDMVLLTPLLRMLHRETAGVQNQMGRVPIPCVAW